MLALFYENSELQFLVLMGELGVYGQYQSRGNSGGARNYVQGGGRQEL